MRLKRLIFITISFFFSNLVIAQNYSTPVLLPDLNKVLNNCTFSKIKEKRMCSCEVDSIEVNLFYENLYGDSTKELLAQFVSPHYQMLTMLYVFKDHVEYHKAYSYWSTTIYERDFRFVFSELIRKNQYVLWFKFLPNKPIVEVHEWGMNTIFEDEENYTELSLVDSNSLNFPKNIILKRQVVDVKNIRGTTIKSKISTDLQKVIMFDTRCKN